MSTLSQAVTLHAESLQAVADLMNRIDTSHTLATRVETRLDTTLGTHEQFIICPPETKGGCALIKGNTVSALTTGLNWYLNHYARINLSWNRLTTNMSRMTLPKVTATEHHYSNGEYRYYLNYCTFGYSMATWSWQRWEQEIDWMALHGINMPLQIVGLESVWRSFLMKDCGYSEAQAEAFVPGPAYTAWWGMNNLQGWGGDGKDQSKGVTDNAWYERQSRLARQITNRERELGMEPVLPGYSGMVPTDFTERTGHAAEVTNRWCGFSRPYIQDPTDKAFAECAAKYYARLQKVMGTSKYYSMDPFHEGGTISSGAYAEGYSAIYKAMNDNVGTGTKWVIQQWQWGNHQRNSLTAVPAGRLIVLDLFSDGKPGFSNFNGYTPQEAIYCTIPNFGGRSGMMGRLKALAANYFTNKATYATIKGVGTAPEAIEQTPITYDLLFELPWMEGQPSVNDWVKDYATSRYGIENKKAQSVWERLLATILDYSTDGIQGPVEDVWAARPNTLGHAASTWGSSIGFRGQHASETVSKTYTADKQQLLISTAYDLISLGKLLAGNENYRYDLVEVVSQVMADYAYHLLCGIGEARNAGNTALEVKRKETFLQLILDMDAFKGTEPSFRLGRWTQEARQAAAEVKGATTATPDWYELRNARQLITTWGDKTNSDGSGLHDYSYRSWQGMLRDVYYPRWQYYFSHDCTAPTGGWFLMEWDWAHRMKWTDTDTEKSATPLKEGDPGYSYSPQPKGNACKLAKRLFRSYLKPVRQTDGSTLWSYRALEDNL